MKRIIIVALVLCSAIRLGAQDVIRLGIIGLDTSHSTAFTELLNSESDDYYVRKFEVVAAYPYGSTTIESSSRRIPSYTQPVQQHGVRITSSIDELLDLVDCVLLETNDGRLHLEQAIQVYESGKICYIDKPLGSTLAEAIAIYEIARRYNAPVFSSSALRFSPENVKLQKGEYGKVLAADCYSPHKTEPTHPDFGFYGIHGVETLFTLMGTGCVSVSRAHSSEGDVVTGIWEDGRIGTFRAIVNGPAVYGGTAFTPDGAVQAGGYAGYMVLLEAILKYFETGVSPVSEAETLEMFAFMKASNMSVERGGAPVTLKEAFELGRKEASELLRGRDLRMTVLSPGDFHAALVQKHSLEGVCDTVEVYASEGPELENYMQTVHSYISRDNEPVQWVERLHLSDSPAAALPPAASAGEFVVLSGNNALKSDYILTAVSKGYNVLSDKPMAIDGEGYSKLQQAYRIAAEKGLVIMDMMTERYEKVNQVTRECLSRIAPLRKVHTESVHHFCKSVSGGVLRRPAWYYDVRQQGEGIADVTTHLVDLMMWQCFPERTITPEDISEINSKSYPTIISLDQFRNSTGCDSFPDYLQPDIRKGKLHCYSNGSISARIDSVEMTFDVRWDFFPPKGGGDSFQATYYGDNGKLEVVQDKSTGFVKELYITPLHGKRTHIAVPSEERTGHEEHFSQLASTFISYLNGETVPEWEFPNTLSKYYLTTQAVEMSRK